MEREFEIGGRKFKLSKVSAFKQFHIVRRLGPILSDLIPAAGKIKPGKDSSEEQRLSELSEIANPIMNGLSKLSDQDAEFVLYGLLSAVEVSQMNGIWAKVANDNSLMIQDIELPVMLQLAGRAFMYNLGNFFAALPAVSAKG